jgi:hypothetical protein
MANYGWLTGTIRGLMDARTRSIGMCKPWPDIYPQLPDTPAIIAHIREQRGMDLSDSPGIVESYRKDALASVRRACGEARRRAARRSGSVLKVCTKPLKVAPRGIGR